MSAPLRGQRRSGIPSLVLPGDPKGAGWRAVLDTVYIPIRHPGVDSATADPLGVRYVGRPTAWGNPTIVKRSSEGNWYVADSQNPDKPHEVFGANAEGKRDAYETAAYDYDFMLGDLDVIDLARFVAPLVGADVLSCWCPLGSPCHANALCELVGHLKSGDLVPGLVATPGVCGGALRIECTNWSVTTVADDVRRFARCEDWTLGEAVYALAIDLEVDPEVVHAAVSVAGVS